MASPNLSEIVTTTLRNRSGMLADNVSDNTALLSRLKSKGNVDPFDGGRTIVQELEYAENSTYKRYSGYEELNISPSDVFSAAEFDIKQAAVAVSISGLELLKNSGKSQTINLLKARIKNAERTMVNNMSSDVYSDGTADGGKQVGGLQLLIADAPTTGTVGGINRANFSFWQNQTHDFSTDDSTIASSSTIQAAMNQLYLKCARNRDVSDLIVADNTYFRHYWESLQDIQRVTDSKMADAGFQNLKFMGSDVVFDGGQGGDAPSAHMYFLNTDYLHYRPHSDRNMAPLDPDRYATNQDAMVKLIGWAGNMTSSNCALQGVLFATA
jgi:hypothetical protein